MSLKQPLKDAALAVVLVESFGSGVGIRALLALRVGCSYVDPGLRQYLVSASGCRPTPRELQTLQGLARGLTNKAITGELGISPEKARDYVLGFHHKLEAKNRTQAVGKAMAPGLKIPDANILATARCHRLQLVIGNTRASRNPSAM